MLKVLSGGDTICARNLYKEYFEFKMAGKIFLVANHLPVIQDETSSIWRRIKVIPFRNLVKEADEDDNLEDTLNTELSGILNWAIEGCLIWQKESLKSNTPESINQAVAEYRESMFPDLPQSDKPSKKSWKTAIKPDLKFDTVIAAHPENKIEVLPVNDSAISDVSPKQIDFALMILGGLLKMRLLTKW